MSENENVQEPTTPIGIQPAAGSTKVVKVAIKEALNNKAKIVKTARVWIGNDAANQIDKYFTKATPTLNKLLKYESLAWKTVQDQVRNGLVAAKVKRTTAESVAYWIRLALEWMI
ncbi:hypothetical protein [Peribacillus simplex]|uniref:hypothetical protein n=1 Tax=Peribacillus simplex TaxID=1478 RepID=UPI00366EE93E